VAPSGISARCLQPSGRAPDYGGTPALLLIRLGWRSQRDLRVIVLHQQRQS
jgi:hypothetical protein